MDENGKKLEKFATLCYPCVLPGGAMGYNENGLFHSVNSLVPKNVCPKKTRETKTDLVKFKINFYNFSSTALFSAAFFLMRAILGARSLAHANEILKDVGMGTSDGFSMNFVYVQRDAFPIFQNIEVAPNSNLLESSLDVHTLKRGESYAHCNKYELNFISCPKGIKGIIHSFSLILILGTFACAWRRMRRDSLPATNEWKPF